MLPYTSVSAASSCMASATAAAPPTGGSPAGSDAALLGVAAAAEGLAVASAAADLTAAGLGPLQGRRPAAASAISPVAMLLGEAVLSVWRLQWVGLQADGCCSDAIADASAAGRMMCT